MTRGISNRFWIKSILWIGSALTVASCEPLLPWVEQLPQIQPGSAASQASATPVQSAETAEIELQIQQQINEIRRNQGLSELRQNYKLADLARRYSQQMAEQGFFSHTSPAGETLVQRVRSTGIIYWHVGENLFKSTNIPQPTDVAVKGWMDSPGHRRNILRPEYRETGVGVWRDGNTYYVTQLFLRSFSF